MYTTSIRNVLTWGVILLVDFSLGSLYQQYMKVKVNESAELQCDDPCPGDVKWTWQSSKWMKEVLFIECQQEEVCVDSIMNRVKVNGSCLLLDPAVYTNTGHYKCYCDGSVLCQIRLRVLIDRIIKVYPGENVTLPCHACPAKLTAERYIPIQWKKYSLRHSWEEMITGGSSSRYEVGPSFLTISNFTASDVGVYCCYCGKKMCYTVLLKEEEKAKGTGN